MSTTVAYDAIGQVTRVSHATPPADPDVQATAPARSLPVLSTQVDGCRGVANYLDKRSVPAAGSAKKCVKTAGYLDRRTLPSPEPAAAPGASLTYDYTWNADGSVASRARTITAPDGATNATSRSYDYDDLARLVESATAGAEVSRYGYDVAGNRTSWAIGDRAVTATLDAAGRVTSTSDGASYAYDAAGSRSSATVDGERTSFAHDAAGRLTGTSAQGRSTAYVYDGLDRRVGSSDTESFGTDEGTLAWDGLLPVAGSRSRHGASSLLRDTAGDALVQSGPSGVSWLLGDARDVTATATSGGVVDDLVSYGDFGGAAFATSGWDAAVGYDGQPGDASLGVDEYFARSYDPMVGSWWEADSWRGELGDPQSLNRYAYVANSPVSFADAFGFARTRVGGGSGARQTAYRAEARNEEIRFRNRVNAHRSTVGQPPVQTLGTSNGRFGGPVPKGSVNQPRSRSGGLQSMRHLRTVRGCRQMDWGCRGVYSGGSAHISAVSVRAVSLTLLPFRTSIPLHPLDRVQSFLNGEQGSMIAAWVLGAAPRASRYDLSSAMTRDISRHSSTEELRQVLRGSLRGDAGARPINEIRGGYAAGNPSLTNMNLARDAATLLLYPIAPSENKTLLALGSYDLQAQNVRIVGPGRAVVTWAAKNDTTAGSLFRGIGTTDWWNERAGMRGPFSRVTQELTWTEEITW